MQQSCKNCGQSFEITQGDLLFYEKVSPVFGGKKYTVPPPTLCPECRMQRRLAYRNERSLFHRKCDLTGKQIIAMYPERTPYTIYDFTEWHSDKWDAMQYGRKADPQRPFITQFLELRREVPRMSFVREGEIVNSDYCNRVSFSKNNYLLFSSSYNEDCYYGTRNENSRNCVDCLFTYKGELLYECVDVQECYWCAWIQNCQNCSHSFFLMGCVGCKHCLFCTNLVQKEYCIFNKQYTKEEYERQLHVTGVNRHSVKSQLLAKFADVKRSMIVKAFLGVGNEDVSGDYLRHCRNVHASFDCFEVEDGRYVQSLLQAKDVMDYSYWGRGVELIYETHACGIQCQRMLFCNECWEGNSNLLYCDSCIGSHHLFGCVGLRHKSYCILNTQYTKEEYETLVPKLIERMRKDGEWGEFFSICDSLFAYNETVAQDYFPLTREEAFAQRYTWNEDEQQEKYLGPKINVSNDIKDVQDNICSQILLCEITGRPYKIIPQELKFYRDMHLPIPRKCPDQRHKERMALRNPRKLWERNCAKCQKPIQTTYAPDRPEIVYCEECYLSTVY